MRSTPGVSVVGKEEPQSMRMMSPPYLSAVIFFPISPTPPKKTTSSPPFASAGALRVFFSAGASMGLLCRLGRDGALFARGLTCAALLLPAALPLEAFFFGALAPPALSALLRALSLAALLPRAPSRAELLPAPLLVLALGAFCAAFFTSLAKIFSDKVCFLKLYQIARKISSARVCPS